jgi:hypothetical protein
VLWISESFAGMNSAGFIITSIDELISVACCCYQSIGVVMCTSSYTCFMLPGALNHHHRFNARVSVFALEKLMHIMCHLGSAAVMDYSLVERFALYVLSQLSM